MLLIIVFLIFVAIECLEKLMGAQMDGVLLAVGVMLYMSLTLFDMSVTFFRIWNNMGISL
jgi:hypothetical protein